MWNTCRYFTISVSDVQNAIFSLLPITIIAHIFYHYTIIITIYTILTPQFKGNHRDIFQIYPWELVYIMIYPVAMVTRIYRQYKHCSRISPFSQRVFFDQEYIIIVYSCFDLSSLLADIDQFFI